MCYSSLLVFCSLLHLVLNFGVMSLLLFTAASCHLLKDSSILCNMEHCGIFKFCLHVEIYNNNNNNNDYCDCDR